MNVILLHGDHIVKSYKRLCSFVDEAKKRDWEIKRFPTKKNLNIKELLREKSLFNKKSLIIINDIIKINKKDIGWLKKNADSFDQTLVIYETKLLKKGVFNLLPKINKSEEYSLPKYIWNFLDSFYPGNITKSLKLFHETIKKEPVEFVFALFCRHIKDLYLVRFKKTLDDIPSWKRERLLNQSNKFEKNKLKKILKKLANIDILAKKSKLNLNDSLDFLIISELE